MAGARPASRPELVYFSEPRVLTGGDQDRLHDLLILDAAPSGSEAGCVVLSELHERCPRVHYFASYDVVVVPPRPPPPCMALGHRVAPGAERPSQILSRLTKRRRPHNLHRGNLVYEGSPLLPVALILCLKGLVRGFYRPPGPAVSPSWPRPTGRRMIPSHPAREPRPRGSRRPTRLSGQRPPPVPVGDSRRHRCTPRSSNVSSRTKPSAGGRRAASAEPSPLARGGRLGCRLSQHYRSLLPRPIHRRPSERLLRRLSCRRWDD